MTQFFYFFTALAGGLAIFIYGLSVMSESLTLLSNIKLEKSLRKATCNDLKGFIWGSLATAVLHSSSAVTVMLVGFVNSGLLDFKNTFGIIMGTNVGTTLNAWLVSLTGIKLLSPRLWVPLVSVLGLFIRLIGKTPKRQSIGLSLLGFSLLMYGMQLMSDSVTAVSDLAWFNKFLLTLESPIAALLTAMVFTGIIQSSSATVGIAEALALTGNITCKIAIPLVLGANIGTCVTALIAAVNTDKNAKRVVLLHFSVNIAGSLICILLIYFALGTEFLNSTVTATDIAKIHTFFNIACAIAFVPFKRVFLRLCEKII